jgi:hypothetical protein
LYETLAQKGKSVRILTAEKREKTETFRISKRADSGKKGIEAGMRAKKK